MKLKRIKAFGFKTFAEPTVLEFSGGITAVVGPNGSGKSNLVDAIRWVLGETSNKSLRSGKLEDVIFAGNEKRKPLGLAEVALTFDNADRSLPLDFKEVEITRRAYRAGESEYFINRAQVRLRDIVELLMGSGLGPGSYAIVSQGQIDAILTSKPTDRRALFEETAGINRFLARKHESLRRLEQTEQNAVRVSDVLSEMERRLPELDGQVRRAKRYRKVSARVRDLEILAFLRASASRRAERDALRVELQQNEAHRGDAAARVALLGAALAEARTTAYRADLELDDLRAAAQSRRAELAGAQAEYAATLARREALEAQGTQTSQDVARVEAERAALREQIVNLQARLEPLRQEIEHGRDEELAAQTALAQARARLDEIFTRLREVEAAGAQHAARKAERRVQSENLRAEAERLEGEAHAALERASHLEIAAGAAAHEYAQREQRVAQLAASALDARGRVEATERQAAEAGQAAAHAVSAHRDSLGDVKAAESRLHTIEELEASLEGHVPGTRAVVEAWQRGDLHGIEGVISNLITTDERYARAMDIAFGARLSNIVTRSSEDAQRGIDYLNAREFGRATFLPLDTLGARDGKTLSAELRALPGVIDYAPALIRTQPQYAGVIRFLVGNVLLVDTLQTGIFLTRQRGLRDTIVTLSGEQITGGGAITGGRFARERSILSRRVQAESLREALTEMRVRLDELETAARLAGERAQATLAQRDAAKAASGSIDIQLAQGRAEMSRLESEAQRLGRDLLAARTQHQELVSQAQAARVREHELETDTGVSEADDQERHRLETELAQAREVIAQAQSLQTAVSAHAGQARETAAALGAQCDAAHSRLGILDQDSVRSQDAREAMLAEIAQLSERTQACAALVERLRTAVGDLDAQLETARQHRESSVDRVSALESDFRLAENEERQTSAGGEQLRMRSAQIDAELGMLSSQFAQNPATDQECRDIEERYRGEPDTITEELGRLREELARLQANVNLNAESEREELGQRETFLREQLEDLSKARETLLASIKEIEGQTQAQFNETFDAVSAAFVEMFTRLFPGGEAKMWQTNPENLSETGIEIAVAPPGKKAMPLASLSGGERAMTAAALIFGLIKIKPSPFYLLDEVDAAMDDANVERFSQMVQEFSESSQMIVVTHNRKTMEMAERMYGVTMGEAGVSAIVSAELATREPEPALV